MTFTFETEIQPDWIDYNGHMRDSYYGLVFSLAVDALQDEVGFDAVYRESTGCTIYLLEGHTSFLREVKVGALVRVETQVLGVDAKRFHLYCAMYEGEKRVSVGEFMELHVRQKPAPHAAPMPPEIATRLQAALVTDDEARALPHRARALRALSTGGA
ncbi:thioesterase family protein [Primorskyibacter sp. S187A]|uniref:thioesterase family protein n=1 Tax=Primorskyibacter sp. S187A TaxID=3415130 RepID=UPI003C7D29A1